MSITVEGIFHLGSAPNLCSGCGQAATVMVACWNDEERRRNLAEVLAGRVDSEELVRKALEPPPTYQLCEDCVVKLAGALTLFVPEKRRRAVRKRRAVARGVITWSDSGTRRCPRCDGHCPPGQCYSRPG